MWQPLKEFDGTLDRYAQTYFDDPRFLEVGKRKVASLFHRYNAKHDVRIHDAECPKGVLRDWTLCTMLLEANLEGNQMPEFLLDVFGDGFDRRLFYYGSNELAKTGMEKQKIQEICQSKYNLLKRNPVSVGPDIVAMSLVDHAIFLIGVILAGPDGDAADIIEQHENEIGEFLVQRSRKDLGTTVIEV